MLERIKQVPLGAWIVLSVFILGLCGILIWAPPEMWSALERADARHIAGVITLIGTSVAGVWRMFQGKPAEALPKKDGSP